MKQIKDIEKCYDLLLEAREILKCLNGDSVIEASKINSFCVRTDVFLGNTHKRDIV